MALVEIVAASAQGEADHWVKWTGIATFLAAAVALLPIGITYFERRRFKRSVAMSLAHELFAARFNAESAQVFSRAGPLGILGHSYNSAVERIDQISIPLTERYLDKFDVFPLDTAKSLLTMHAKIVLARATRDAFPRRTNLVGHVEEQARAALFERALVLSGIIAEAHEMVAKLAKLPAMTNDYVQGLEVLQRGARPDLNGPAG